MKSLVLAAVAVLILPAFARSDVMPVFRLNPSIWRATHIVVATEGKGIDGNLTVLESWHGDLKKGESIVIHEPNDGIDSVHDSARQQEIVSRQKMILFLVLHPSDNTNVWTGANHNSVPLSTIWVEGGKCFCYQQPDNPGPVLILEHLLGEEQIRERVVGLLMVKDVLKKAKGIDDSKKRAEELAQVACHAALHYEAEVALFEALAECDQYAIPVLKDIIEDHQKRKLHPKAISTLASVGKDTVGSDLVKWLESEVHFWKAHPAKDDSLLAREHEARTLALLSAISDIRYIPAISSVADLRRTLAPPHSRGNVRLRCNEIHRKLILVAVGVPIENLQP